MHGDFEYGIRESENALGEPTDFVAENKRGRPTGAKSAIVPRPSGLFDGDDCNTFLSQAHEKRRKAPLVLPTHHVLCHQAQLSRVPRALYRNDRAVSVYNP